MANVTWWSIPQAVAWIVTRSRVDAQRAAALGAIWQLNEIGLIPAQGGDSPPVPLSVAPEELLEKARKKAVRIRGRYRGKGAPCDVPVMADDRLYAWGKEARIGPGHDGILTDPAYWSALYIEAEACVRCWPPSPRATPRDDVNASGTVAADAVSSGPGAEASTASRVPAVWLVEEIGRRHQGTEPDRTDRESLMIALKVEFPDLDKDERRDLIRTIPNSLKGKPGPKKSG